MPVITFKLDELKRLLGTSLKIEELSELLFNLKGEVEQVASGEISVEVTPDRPDLFSVEGIARALKGLLGIEAGIPSYQVVNGSIRVYVTDDVKQVRPAFSTAVVKGLKVDDELIKELMEFQEKLHQTIGRNRRKVSIGIHDLDKVTPPIIYTAKKPENIRFIPLGENVEMNALEVVQKIEKGRTYGYIISSFEKWPVLLDAKGNVLSMPPIINSELTRVTEETRNLFIDVTGTDEEMVRKTAVIIACNLAERGATIETVEVVKANLTEVHPCLEERYLDVSVKRVSRLLGIQVTPRYAVKLLRKMRLEAKQIDEDVVRVYIPPWRVDFLHEVDVAEEVAMAHGYNRVEPSLPDIMTIGEELKLNEVTNKVRDLMVGMGFQEVINYMLTNKETLFKNMLTPEQPVVEVEKPVSERYTVLRTWLTPGLLAFLGRNTHEPYPQKVFEVGDVVLIDEKSETKTKDERRVAAAVTDYSVSYEDIQAPLYTLLNLLDVEFDVTECNHPSLIPGRAANILDRDGRVIGFLGEVKPEVLLNFKVISPVAVFELSLSSILTQLSHI